MKDNIDEVNVNNNLDQVDNLNIFLMYAGIRNVIANN